MFMSLQGETLDVVSQIDDVSVDVSEISNSFMVIVWVIYKLFFEYRCLLAYLFEH